MTMDHMADFMEQFARNFYAEIVRNANWNKKGPFLHDLPDITIECIRNHMSYNLFFGDKTDANNHRNIEIKSHDIIGLSSRHSNPPALAQITCEIGKVIDDWKQLTDLPPVFIDKRNDIHDIEANMPYIISCGYIPEGEIRETHISTEIKGSSHNHIREQVTEYGLIFNRTESVVTGSTCKSEQKKKYKYWQVYKL